MSIVYSNLHKYGKDVLTSEEFDRAMKQPHHVRCSVGRHTLRVVALSIWCCYLLEKIHVHTDTEDVVKGALCHDLGILGRDQKYENNRQCCREHPLDSVEVARNLVPNLSEKCEDIIRTHMWPLTKGAPTSKEGVIVSAADKIASVRDFLSFGEGKDGNAPSSTSSIKSAESKRME